MSPAARRQSRNAAPPDTSVIRPSRPCDPPGIDVHRPSLERERVDAILADLGVDDHDGDRGMAMFVEVDGAASVAGEVAGDPFAEGEVVAKRLDGSMMPPE